MKFRKLCAKILVRKYARAFLREKRKANIMIILEYVLLGILLLSAVFIVVAVVLQKSNEDGLSGSIAGGAETFYGKDKSAHTDRALYKWTLIAAIVFAVAVLLVFIIQPDYAASYSLDDWKNEYINKYSYIFSAN